MMEKIATPDELQAEIRKLLTYAKSGNPSRHKLAQDLKTLASRTAIDKQASGPLDAYINKGLEEWWETVVAILSRRYGNVWEIAGVWLSARFDRIDPTVLPHNEPFKVKISARASIANEKLYVGAEAVSPDGKRGEEDMQWSGLSGMNADRASTYIGRVLDYAVRKAAK
jgi:hypothetical protein